MIENMCTKERRERERSLRPSSLLPSSHFLQHHGSQCATLETGSADSPRARSLSVLASKCPAGLFKVKQRTEITNKAEDSHLTQQKYHRFCSDSDWTEQQWRSQSHRPIFIQTCFQYVVKEIYCIVRSDPDLHHDHCYKYIDVFLINDLSL